MTEKIQQSVDAIIKMAAKQEAGLIPERSYSGARPANALSRSIRNIREAEQFQAELKAVIARSKNN